MDIKPCNGSFLYLRVSEQCGPAGVFGHFTCFLSPLNQKIIILINMMFLANIQT
jgi:hypothetical protein